MKARRPYLLRAIHEWICDSGCTPHVVVDAGIQGVEVPRQYVKEGKIVLNVSWDATAGLRLGNDELTFSGRFGGVSMSVRVPMVAVLAIYARESGQGMIFAEDDADPRPPGARASTSDTTPPREPSPTSSGSGDGRRARLKVVK